LQGGQKAIVHFIVWLIHSIQGIYIDLLGARCSLLNSNCINLFNIQYSLIHKHDGHCRYYTKKWLEEGVGRVPPHKDKEVSQMRMQCFKKFFRNPEELAQVKEEYSRFSSCSEEFNDPDSIHDRFAVSPMTWWTNHGQSIPLLMTLAIKLISQPASSSCCERNWSTYSFIHSVKRNALTVEC
jgi:hypothetical protein